MGGGKRKKAVSAIDVIAVSLAMVISIEALSFQIDVSSFGLEKAIQDAIYIQADVFETETKNDMIFAVYGHTGHPDAGGLACFQKGFLGKCRFVFAHHYNAPLIFAERAQHHEEAYLVGFAFDSFGESPVLGCMVGETDADTRTYYFSHPGKPFIQIEPIEKNEKLMQKTYFDTNLNETEIDQEWLEAHSDQDTPFVSSDAADLYVVRFTQLAILFLGLVRLWVIYRKNK